MIFISLNFATKYIYVIRANYLQVNTGYIIIFITSGVFTITTEVIITPLRVPVVALS